MMSGSGPIYVHEVVIGCRGEVIARHPRCWDRDELVFDPIHYLPLIEQKINALDQAAPLQGWDLPEAVRHTAPPDGGANEPAGSTRICLGPAAFGNLRSGRSAGGCDAGPSAGGAQLRCDTTSVYQLVLVQNIFMCLVEEILLMRTLTFGEDDQGSLAVAGSIGMAKCRPSAFLYGKRLLVCR